MPQGERSRFKIEITEKDIERAKINDSSACVVTQAIARAVPGAVNISTDTQSIRFTLDGARMVYLTPYAVQGYVIAFDAGDPIEPFSFQLREPVRVKRRIRTEEGKAALRAYNKERASSGKAATQPAASGPTDKPKPAPELADARAAYADVASKAKGKLSTTTKGERQAPPRVFKTKQRAYGHRLLRINQIDQAQETK